MEIINIALVEVDLNADGTFRKFLRIENSNSYEFLSLPGLSQISFYKEPYEKLINEGTIVVKEIPNQPQITYMI